SFGAGAWAQSSTPVDFATTNLLSGVSITLNVSYTDPSGVASTTTVTFTSPGPSAAIAVQPGSAVTYSGFPTSVTDGTATYAFDRANPPSGFTASGTGTPTHVVGRYGLLVDFAALGLPDGTSLSAVVSYTNNRGTGISNQSVPITTPNASTPINTQLGSTLTFTYPSSITVGRQTYPLVSVSPASGFTTGAAGPSTHVVAIYGSVPPTVTAAASQSADEGASTSFDLGSFVDPDGGPWSVDVDWGDGS